MLSEGWHIQLLGGLQAQRGGQVITRFRTRRAGALLAYLAYYLHRPHPREVLIELLWPGADPGVGRDRLNQELASLRRQLEPPDVPACAILCTDRSGVQLNPATVTTDVGAFEVALETAARAKDPLQRALALQQAVDLYRGVLLPGFYEDWIVPEQERLAEACFQALCQLAVLHQQAGELPRAIDCALRAVTTDPLREEAHLLLMRLYVAAGQPAAALRQYRALERILQEQFGEPPSPATQRLARTLQDAEHSDGALTGGARHTPTTTLRGVEEEQKPSPSPSPTPPPLPTSTPAPPALHHRDACDDRRNACVTRRNACVTRRCPRLPLTFTRFFGREEEIERIVEMLTAPGRRGDTLSPDGNLSERCAGSRSALGFPLVTLTGPGGTGKTRLAIETAHRVAEHFAGAVWFVGLADISDPRLIPEEILEALRLPRIPQQDPLEQVVEYLQALGTRGKALGDDSQRPTPCLLVLDNLEHLLNEDRRKGEDGAAVVKTLRERVSSLTLLVTSRQRLNLEGEREFPVPPLPIPEVEPQRHPEEEIQRPGAGVRGALRPDAPERGGRDVPRTSAQRSLLTPEQLMQYPSVQLFVDRAQAARPDFQVTERNAQAVAELCARLEGIPLAIELCAARAQVVTSAQMLAQLEDRYAFLVSRRRDASERHRTLRAAMEWSYRLLSAEVQRFFRRLSVFRGGWTLEAAEVVCAEPLALDYLARLRECSLVLSDETALGMRFRMLETLREYGWERLTVEEQADVSRRHAEYFLNLKRQAEPYLWGAGRTVWLERLEADHGNLCTVLERAKRGEHTPLGLQLAVEMVQFWYGLGYGRKALDYLLALLEQDTGADLLLRSRALNQAGDLAHTLGEAEVARHVYTQQEQLMRQLGNESDPDLLYIQGRLALEASDYGAARRHFEKALEGMRRLNRWEGIFYVITEIGHAATQQGDLVGVIPLLEESAAICREHQSLGGEAHALLALGNALYYQGSQQPDSAPVLERAREYLERSRQIRRTMKHLAGEADTLLSLGRVFWKEAQYAEAEAQMSESLRMYRRLGDLSGVEKALDALAQVRGTDAERGGRNASTDGESGAIRQASVGRAVSAARLAGAAEAIREVQRRMVLPSERPDHDRCLSTLRAMLGEEAFMAAWETGRAMMWEEAVVSALGEDPSARGSAAG